MICRYLKVTVVVVTKHCYQKQLEERVYFAGTSISQFMIVGARTQTGLEPRGRS